MTLNHPTHHGIPTFRLLLHKTLLVSFILKALLLLLANYYMQPIQFSLWCWELFTHVGEPWRSNHILFELLKSSAYMSKASQISVSLMPNQGVSWPFQLNFSLRLVCFAESISGHLPSVYKPVS